MLDRRRIAVLLVLAAAIAAAVLALRARRAPPRVTVAGVAREERCLECHADVRGVGAAHAAIGCSACHGGVPSAKDRESAHAGVEVLAGDLASAGATCGQAGCHPSETARVQTSLMARAPGILAVDRFAFGERATPAGAPEDDLTSIDAGAAPRTPAESHARQLCASCHLAAKKAGRGDLGLAARGGGCTACHWAPPAEGGAHPSIVAAVSEQRCEGCHARSGRIALSFHGAVELEPSDPRVERKLADGRGVGATTPDVHAKAGMTCVDCHTERELMGDGTPHRHSDDARDVTCADCHRPEPGRVAAPDREDVAARLRAAWARRARPAPSPTPLLTRAGTPLWRTDAKASALMLAATGERRSIPRASDAPYHALRGHERLACQACHSPWTLRCASCHTRLDPDGEGFDHLARGPMRGLWTEVAGANGFGPPLLAIDAAGRIAPFLEGMRLSIEGVGAAPVARDLYAPLDPHTTGRARPCLSCHAPERPDDVYPPAGEATRPKARLLDAAERARVLEVGRCARCHGYDAPIWSDLDASRARLRRGEVPRCGGPR